MKARRLLHLHSLMPQLIHWCSIITVRTFPKLTGLAFIIPGDVPGEINSITWFYIPQASGTLVFRYPDNHELAPGEYWAGLFCCDGYDLYAQTSFVISEGLPNAVIPVNSSEKLAVFPNPTGGIFTIKSSEGENMQQIKVYSMSGMLVYQEKVTGSNTEKTLDLTKLNKGVYFLEIQTGNFKASKKLIIQ